MHLCGFTLTQDTAGHCLSLPFYLEVVPECLLPSLSFITWNQETHLIIKMPTLFRIHLNFLYQFSCSCLTNPIVSYHHAAFTVHSLLYFCGLPWGDNVSKSCQRDPRKIIRIQFQLSHNCSVFISSWLLILWLFKHFHIFKLLSNPWLFDFNIWINTHRS